MAVSSLEKLLSEVAHLRPFEPQPDFSSAIRIYNQNKSVVDEQSVLTCISALESRIHFSFANSPPLFDSIINAIVSLQGVIARSENMGSDGMLELSSLAKQLFFKTCGDVLFLKKQYRFVRVLQYLSFQSVSSITFEDTDVAAFSARLLIESFTILAECDFYPNCLAVPLPFIWNALELADEIVGNLMPEDENMRRIHTRIFREALSSIEPGDMSVSNGLDQFRSEFLGKKIRDHIGSKSVLCALVTNIMSRNYDGTLKRKFFLHIFDGLPIWPSSNDFRYLKPDNLTISDMMVFLFYLSSWCSLCSSVDILLSSKISISNDHCQLWKNLIKYVVDRREGKSSEPAVLLNVRKVLECTRLYSLSSHLKIMHSTFRWMERASFTRVWLYSYATCIEKTYQGITIADPKHIFAVPDEDTDKVVLDVVEEDAILNDVTPYLALKLADNGAYLEALSILKSVETPYEGLEQFMLEVLNKGIAMQPNNQVLKNIRKQIKSDLNSILSSSFSYNLRTPQPCSISKPVAVLEFDEEENEIPKHGSENIIDVVSETTPNTSFKTLNRQSPFQLAFTDVDSVGFATPSSNIPNDFSTPDSISNTANCSFTTPASKFGNDQSLAPRDQANSVFPTPLTLSDSVAEEGGELTSVPSLPANECSEGSEEPNDYSQEEDAFIEEYITRKIEGMHLLLNGSPTFKRVPDFWEKKAANLQQEKEYVEKKVEELMAELRQRSSDNVEDPKYVIKILEGAVTQDEVIPTSLPATRAVPTPINQPQNIFNMDSFKEMTRPSNRPIHPSSFWNYGVASGAPTIANKPTPLVQALSVMGQLHGQDYLFPNKIHSEFCFGCLEDKDAERALHFLDELSEKWNTNSQSDTE